MNILKAYADAGAMGQQGYGALKSLRQGAPAQNTARPAQKGDFLSLSEEAQALLVNGGQKSISVMPQDATYDQNGQVMRQIDSLQGDLRQLAAQFMAQGGAGGMLGRLGSMQSRLSSIRAQV